MLGFNALSTVALSALLATATVPGGDVVLSGSGDIQVSGQAVIRQSNPVLGHAPMSGGALSDNGRTLPFAIDPRATYVKGSGGIVVSGKKLATGTVKVKGSGDLTLAAGNKSSGAPSGTTKNPVLGFAPMSGGALSDNIAGTAAAQSNRFVIISDVGTVVAAGEKIGQGAAKITGSGDLVVAGRKLDVRGREVVVSGSGGITVSGRRAFQFVVVRTSGGIRVSGQKLAIGGHVVISGSGDIRLFGPQPILMIGPIVPIFTRATFFAPVTRAEIRTLAPRLLLPDVT